jgi:hypothetical protein
MEDDEAELPKLGEHAINGQLGEARVEVAVLELGQIYHRNSGLDFGVDGVVEFVTGTATKMASGRQIGVQVKRGLSAVKATRYGRTLYCNEQHANYWLSHSLPIIVVQSDPDSDRLRWQHVNGATLRRTPNGFAIDLPDASEMRSSLSELRDLASACSVSTSARAEVLTIQYDPRRGVTNEPDELGLAGLAFVRAALRDERCRLDIEYEGEADLIAQIDMIRDIPSPSAEQRREAIIQLDILHRFQQHGFQIRRALTLLLSDKVLAASYGYQERWVVEAIRNAAPSFDWGRRPDDQHLDAWPGYHLEHPTVRFQVSRADMQDFYDRDSINQMIIRMGAAGGVLVGDLPAEAVATRFLPALAHKLIAFADENNLSEGEALAKIGVFPNFWLVGIA